MMLCLILLTRIKFGLFWVFVPVLGVFKRVRIKPGLNGHIIVNLRVHVPAWDFWTVRRRPASLPPRSPKTIARDKDRAASNTGVRNYRRAQQWNWFLVDSATEVFFFGRSRLCTAVRRWIFMFLVGFNSASDLKTCGSLKIIQVRLSPRDQDLLFFWKGGFQLLSKEWILSINLEVRTKLPESKRIQFYRCSLKLVQNEPSNDTTVAVRLKSRLFM